MREIVKETQFEIKPFTKVIIGDPMYLESIENGTTRGCEKDMVAIYNKIPFSNRNAYVTIRRIKDSFKSRDKEIFYYTTDIIVGSEKKTIQSFYKVHLKDAWCPNYVKKHITLGCDTASFCICTDKNYNEISTGADGFFGDFYHYKNNNAYIFHLSLDEDMVSFNDAVAICELLFYKKEEKKCLK